LALTLALAGIFSSPAFTIGDTSEVPCPIPARNESNAPSRERHAGPFDADMTEDARLPIAVTARQECKK
jgi:hypothetical protein